MPRSKVEMYIISEEVVSRRRPARCHVGALAAGSLVLLATLVTVAVVVSLHYTSGHASQYQTESILNYSKKGLSNQAIKKWRLPRSLIPLHYNVELQTYLLRSLSTNFPFKGNVSIWIKCSEATNKITLHASKLQLRDDSIRVYGEPPGQHPWQPDPQVVSYEMTNDTEFLILNLDRDLQVNMQYVIQMTFSGVLGDGHSGMGFYTSRYNTRWFSGLYAATQFEPTLARRAFPCFDEPALKSTFNVTLVRPRNFKSLSNAEVIDSSCSFVEKKVTFVKDVYDTSPYMSTYLLAFVVSNFHHLSQTTSRGVKIRTWSVPKLVNSTRYALNISIGLLEFFEEFCNISYQIPKLDMISLPKLKFAAMENWGLVIYKEKYFLFTKGITSLSEQSLIAQVVSHELAHQWFGNLVTLTWWDDFWMNEGFATYMGTLGLDHIYPDWEARNQFVVTKMFNSMNFDSSINTQPVQATVAGRTDEIMDLPSEIMYYKGAALIRMISYCMGLNSFNTAVRHSSLLNEPLNVKDIMDSWIHQTSYPLVTVTRIDGAAHSLYLTQERFTGIDNRAGVYESQNNQTWSIPLTFMTRGSMRVKQDDLDIHWMWKNETNKIVTLNDRPGTTEDAGNWVLVNIYHSGYYRVNYDVTNWMALCAQLKNDHTIIPALNRAQIINDAWTLAKSGQLSVSVAMATLDYLHKESDYNVWHVVEQNIQYLSTMLASTSVFSDFTRFMRSKLRAPYKNYSLQDVGNSYAETNAKMIVLKLACRHRLKDCLVEARRQFTLWMKNWKENPIDINFREIVYCSAISYGGWKEWDFAYRMIHFASDTRELVNVMTSLSCTKSPKFINSVLESSLNKSEGYLRGGYHLLFEGFAHNPASHSLVWNFYLANSDRLHELFGHSILHSITGTLNKQLELDQLEKLSREYPSADSKQLSKVRYNVQWIEHNIQEIQSFLQRRNTKLC